MFDVPQSDSYPDDYEPRFADPRIGADLFAGFGLSADALEQLIQGAMDDRVPGMTVALSLSGQSPMLRSSRPRLQRLVVAS